MANKAPGHDRREKIRNQFWGGEDAWTGDDEKGWFRAPRTLPLILLLLKDKRLTGSLDPASVYLELWSRHMSAGVIEMAHEGEHSYASGYSGTRSVRTWQERMKILEELGFIKSQMVGNQRHRYVLLVHPTVVIQRLFDEKKIAPLWWDTYRARQSDTREASYNERKNSNVVQIGDAKKRA